jgi:hypothetical protein
MATVWMLRSTEEDVVDCPLAELKDRVDER